MKKIIILICLIPWFFCSSASSTTTYKYDALNRIVKVKYNNQGSIAYQYDSNGNILSVIPQVTTSNTDVDQDGLPDEWEVFYFGDTTTANDKSDWDRDGYTDLQEYLNQANNETDPVGGVYDPKMMNAPGGTGYADSDADFWILMIPVLINNAQQK